MKPDLPIRQFVIAFIMAVVLYCMAYTAIEHRRTRKGPWQVTFTNTPAGESKIIIDQPALGLTDVAIVFTGSFSNESATIQFRQPRQVPFPVPFGKCVFMDTTFLPGTVTFQFFGHEIELLPRAMIVDHKEQAWHSGETLVLEQNKDAGGTQAVPGK